MKWFNRKPKDNGKSTSISTTTIVNTTAASTSGKDSMASSSTPYKAAGKDMMESSTPYKAAGKKDIVESSTPYKAEYYGDTEDQVAMEEQSSQRRGYLFMGCLCDMRIATVVMNAINIAVRLILILIVLIRREYTFAPMEYCLLMLSVLGIVGALNYMAISTGVSALGFAWFFVVHITSSWNTQWYLWVLDLLILYPTAIMTFQISNGIMSKDRYEEEEYMLPTVRSRVAAMV